MRCWRSCAPPSRRSPLTERALAEAAAALRGAERIAVACHIGPDGDALGSILAFALSLGSRVTPGWGTEPVVVPAQYEFLPGTDRITAPSDFPDADVFLAVDCASADRLGLLLDRFERTPVRINLDHHVSNTHFGGIDLVDPKAASSAELMLALLERMGARIDADIATCLYVGLVTDTGRFSYDAVTPRTHGVAGKLIGLGVKVGEVSRAVFESLPYGYLKTLGVVLERCELTTDPPLVVTWLCQDDLRATGLSFDETEGFIDVVRSIREADVASILKELVTGQWKVSLRSKGATDVGAIAKMLGGGGHTLAAGYESDVELEPSIAKLRKLLATGDFARP